MKGEARASSSRGADAYELQLHRSLMKRALGLGLAIPGGLLPVGLVPDFWRCLVAATCLRWADKPRRRANVQRARLESDSSA